ncbi:hypothetical protein [Deinococcus pimensis]|uniref:hypothetical protein n=1 Tax=Deinococcus pimensis TaxID=309888 RepID=UPI0004856C85|nr:hypothetical protein [Deinococcus pimensis]
MLRRHSPLAAGELDRVVTRLSTSDSRGLRVNLSHVQRVRDAQDGLLDLPTSVSGERKTVAVVLLATLYIVSVVAFALLYTSHLDSGSVRLLGAVALASSCTCAVALLLALFCQPVTSGGDL